MSEKTNIRAKSRKARQARVRRKVKGSDMKPRLCVFRSLRYTYAQLISDDSGRVLGTVTSRALDLERKGSVETAKQVGLRIAELAMEQNIREVVFDRNGYVYHGRVAAVADGAREGGLKF